jgi:membrane-anchored protein YejM (alkaline phosphatase superfamily)
VVAVTSPKAGAESGFQQVNRLVLRPSGGGGREIALNETDAPLVRAMYDSGVAYMDEKIGGLLRELEAGQVARPTVVVFTSDHGEALLEHGLAGHIDLYDHTLLVPRRALPDGRGAGRVERQVRLIDVCQQSRRAASTCRFQATARRRCPSEEL